MTRRNHLIDPTYFYDAIEEFAFDYDIYTIGEVSIDDYGKKVSHYNKSVIRGSLQTQGSRVTQSKEGNTIDLRYEFYCKSLYRINIGDIIEYNGNYLRVNFVHDYDEFGVREASLTMIQLSAYRDFADYLKYINGEKIV